MVTVSAPPRSGLGPAISVTATPPFPITVTSAWVFVTVLPWRLSNTSKYTPLRSTAPLPSLPS